MRGTFTTARVSGGRIARRALHRARLLHDGGAAALVDEALREADARARELGDGMVRVLLVREGDRVVPRVEAGPARRRPWTPGDPALRLMTRPDPRPPGAPLVKSLDRAAFAPLEEEARAVGVDGVVLEGPEGLREGTWFHLAVRIAGVWRTPRVGEGVIFGTTRAAFLEALAARGEPFEEGSLTRAHLERAQGAVALSSLLGLAPVARVDCVSIPLLDLSSLGSW